MSPGSSMPEGKALASRPDLRVYAGFVGEAERRALLAWAMGRLEAEGDDDPETGPSVELVIEQSPALSALTRRVEALVGFESAVRGTVRFRRYGSGQGHPPHLDDYQIDGASLVATAMLTIEAPEAGGHTEFAHAAPWPVAVSPREGQLAIWHNVTASGDPEPRSLHQGAPVSHGHKGVLLWFFYLPIERWTASPRPAPPLARHEPPPPGTVLTCVDDGVPSETVKLLHEACARRAVLFRRIDARSFGYHREDRLPPCSMLYRPAVSTAACQVEDFLQRGDVASFHDGDPYFTCSSPQQAMERAGVTLPRTFPVASVDPSLVASFVERLGGYPVVVKAAGGEGGVGVMRADSEATLRALLDYLVRGLGRTPTLSAYIPDAMHVRVIVVGERAVACYDNPVRPGDFRSIPSGDQVDYRADVPESLASVAVRATRAQRLFFGGVDLLRHTSGRVYVLEVNFPCFFAQATLGGGIDVAGPMVEFLIQRARAMATAAPPAQPAPPARAAPKAVPKPARAKRRAPSR